MSGMMIKGKATSVQYNWECWENIPKASLLHYNVTLNLPTWSLLQANHPLASV